MSPVNLYDLKNYTPPLIMEYLTHFNTTTFDIIIPKEDTGTPPDNYIIFWNYYSVAYAGQLLYNIAGSFAAYIPCPYKTNPFRFEIEIENLSALAHTLAFMVDGLLKDDEAMLHYNSQAIDYFDDAFNGEIHSNCWDLLAIADAFLEKI